MGVEEHQQNALRAVTVGIVTLSTTRGPADDDSGRWMAEQAGREGHRILFHHVLPDDAKTIRTTTLRLIEDHEPHVILMNGGTGTTPLDVTIEAVRPLFHKELTAFAALFAMLSHEEIGAAAMLSRATAGIIHGTAVFCMPGSIKACRLACTRLIFPELGHLARHIRTN